MNVKLRRATMIIDLGAFALDSMLAIDSFVIGKMIVGSLWAVAGIMMAACAWLNYRSIVNYKRGR